MNYPPPSIPLSPVLSGHRLHLSGDRKLDKDAHSILANPNILHVTSGRAAIALALEHSRVAEGDEVLVPAFHCESMVSPVKWRGASPVFYKICGDTTVNLDDIKQKLSAKTKAIIVTHYFGFIQNMTPIVQLCNQRGLILIEDCAHAFFGIKDGKSVGTWGDYSIASCMKFFPVYDGGILASTKHNLNSLKLEPPSIFFQIKSPLNTIQTAISYKRLGWPGVIINYLTTAAEGAWRLFKQASGRKKSGISGPSSSGGGYGLEEEWIHCRSSWFSTLVIKHQRVRRIAEERRKNYLKLHKALCGLPHSHTLYETLPEGIVPLVFPLYVDYPEQHFDKLKRAGVPIWRFGEYLDDEITEEVCSNSVDLSEHVFQFPCQQELSEDELNWMINQIVTCFNAIKDTP